jgi:hypothetical protein
MFADQAIFMSMARQGKAGYHLVARSPGVSESEAGALSTWSPSHGGLIVDGANRSSVNFFPLPSGRYAVARTREGGAEYSGRGGRLLFTRAVVVNASRLERAGYQPFAVYRDALALGHLAYDPSPPPALKPVELSSVYVPRDGEPFAGVLRELGIATIESVVAQLEAGRGVVLPYAGDRAALAELLLGRLAPELALATSFATSLHPSSVRPFRLNLVATG